MGLVRNPTPLSSQARRAPAYLPPRKTGNIIDMLRVGTFLGFVRLTTRVRTPVGRPREEPTGIELTPTGVELNGEPPTYPAKRAVFWTPATNSGTSVCRSVLRTTPRGLFHGAPFHDGWW